MSQHVAHRHSDEIHQLRAEIERLRAALHQIDSWSRAYPLTIFPQPDLKKARKLLEAGGITLDAVSADCMRHVVEGVGGIARAALDANSAVSVPYSGSRAVTGPNIK